MNRLRLDDLILFPMLLGLMGVLGTLGGMVSGAMKMIIEGEDYFLPIYVQTGVLVGMTIGTIIFLYMVSRRPKSLSLRDEQMLNHERDLMEIDERVCRD